MAVFHDRNDLWICQNCVSDIGAGILDFDDSVRCLDDVVDRFLDAIEFYNKEVGKVEEDFKEVMKLQFENPLENYDATFAKLSLNRDYYTETRDMLQKDLDRIRGYIAPWE